MTTTPLVPTDVHDDKVAQLIAVLHRSSQQQQLLTQEHYDRHVIEPLARSVLPLIDVLIDQQRLTEQELQQNAAKLLTALQYGLFDWLSSHDITPIEPKPGDPFNAKHMCAVQKDITWVPRCDMTVKRCSRIGLLHRERVLRPANVAIYQLTPQLKGAS